MASKPESMVDGKMDRRQGLIFMTVPALGWYGFFMIMPAVSMFIISMLHWPGLLASSEFAGFENYSALWNNRDFRAALYNTAVQVSVVLVLMIPAAFMLGYYLNLKPPGHRVLRVLFFLPAILSVSARAMVFFGIFAPNGLVNGLLDGIGLEQISRPWLANRETSLWVVIFVDLWAGIGFSAVLFASRLSSVSHEIYEAAELDGADHWSRMWLITYPIVKDYVGVVTMLQFLWTLFYSAATILLLTKGGPGASSTTLSFLVYEQAFIRQNLGFSQAVGVVLFAVGLIGMVVIMRAFQRNY